VTRSIHGQAEADLAEAFRFYRREAGRGMHPMVGFPYPIIDRQNAGDNRILVVRHQSRDPDHGQNRN
jgi:hypothetical protein